MLEPVGILKNTATGTFHPIVFRQAPMLSRTDENSGAIRHRSKGHLTEGLPTLEDAQAWIEQRPNSVDCGAVWEWDGETVPAMVEWFSKQMFQPAPEKVDG